MATNKEIKNKHKFVEATNIFRKAIEEYEKAVAVFNVNIVEKENYIDERSDSWRAKDDNQLFREYIVDSGSYVIESRSLLNEFSILILPDLDKYERQETSSGDD